MNKDKAIRRTFLNESLEGNLCFLGVLQIRAGAEPEGYNLLYPFSLNKFSSFNLPKKDCSEASRFNVGSSSILSNLEVSEIIF